MPSHKRHLATWLTTKFHKMNFKIIQLVVADQSTSANETQNSRSKIKRDGLFKKNKHQRRASSSPHQSYFTTETLNIFCDSIANSCANEVAESDPFLMDLVKNFDLVEVMPYLKAQIQKYCTMSSMVESKGPVFQAITSVITEKLQPAHLEVLNESFMHNVPKGSETHFKVLIVSKNFEGLTLIKRHRLVNNILKDKLGEVFPHALSIEAKTPEQWQPSYIVEPSPNCKGGFGK